MVDPHANGCPEPEVLAAYVDRGLSLSERARVDAHLASCPQCIALVAGAARTVAELSAQLPDAGVAAEATPFVHRHSLAGVLAAAAAVIAVVAAPSLVGPWFDRDSGLVSLVGSVGEHRSVLGRLTGGFPHAPLGVPSAGGQDGRTAGTDRVQLTAGKIRESFGDHLTPAQLHASGIQQLLAGDYNEAAQSLLAASREQPANARYLNDVATLQLERDRLGLRPDDLPRALSAADRARRLDPSLNEAWFNRALAVTALSLNSEAAAAWNDYLKRDATSPWAAEARKRLIDLERPSPAARWASIEARLEQSKTGATADDAVRAQATEARNRIETRLLPGWATAVLNGGNGQAELSRIRPLADAMLRVSGDTLYRDTVTAIDQVDIHGTEARRALALAHLQYAEAASLFVNDLPRQAAPKLKAAQQALAASRSPYQWRAALDLGAALYFTGEAAIAAPLLAEIVAHAQQAGFKHVVGRSLWQQGLAAFQQGRISDAQARYDETLATFDAMGDVEQSAGAHSLLAALHFSLGDKQAEWQHRQAALNALPVINSPRVRYQILASTAAAVRFDAPETALLMQESVIGTARAWGRSAAIADALAQRSSTLISLGRAPEAAASIAEARDYLSQVTDESLRRVFELPILAAESDLFRQAQPKLAVEAATRAIDIARDRGDRSRLPQFQLRLAKANIVWGNLPAADRALSDGMRAFDEERASLTDEGRLSASDESWQLFDTAVQLAVHRGNYDRAFALAERGRARSLVERRLAENGPSLAEARRLLKPGEVVVALTQFDDEVAIWALSRYETKVVTRGLNRTDAARLVARQQLEIAREGAPVASALLYDELVQPIAAQLNGAKRVAFIPDETYADASFAALWNKADGRFLVERMSVTGAPSLWALSASSAARGRSGPGDDVLVMSAAARADQPARTIASVYANPAMLQSAEATRSRFISEIAKRRIVHVSAPSRHSNAFPLLSGVRLADDPGLRHSGLLLGREIAAQQLSHTNLVVIDEVESNPRDRGEGTLSMARAFMAAGVPAALGTLPGADENATRDLMIAFHREMSRKVSAAQALQTVQRNAIHQNGRRLGAWTALVLYGSDR